MSTLRVVTSAGEDGSVVIHQEELDFEDFVPPANPDRQGVTAVALHRSDAPAARWHLYRVAPNTLLPMHQTSTLDYVLIVDGEVELTVPGGAGVRLKAGDTVVQMNVLHAWETGDSPVTLAAVMMSVPPTSPPV